MKGDWILVVGERDKLIESFLLANNLKFVYIMRHAEGCKSISKNKFAFALWDTRSANHDDSMLNEFLKEFGAANPEAKRLVIVPEESSLKFRSDFIPIKPPEMGITQFEDLLGVYSISPTA